MAEFRKGYIDIGYMNKQAVEAPRMEEDADLEIFAYPLGNPSIETEIRPAERIRDWQLKTQDSFATRCLPMNVANNNGWEFILPGGFDAVFTGGNQVRDIAIYPHGNGPVLGASHFGHGVLTFYVSYLFRTPSGVHLQINGPTNWVKDGIQALSGILETDWSPYGTTMNWKFTRTGRVRFEKGEPYAQIAPVPAAYVNRFTPRFASLEDREPEALKDHSDWRNSRAAFNHGLHEKDPDTVQQKWQKLYYRGLFPDQTRKAPEHYIRLSPRAFTEHGEFPPGKPSVAFDPNYGARKRAEVTLVLRVDGIDWRTWRAIDEAAAHAEQVLVLVPKSRIDPDKIRRDVPYANVEIMGIGDDEEPLACVREASRYPRTMLLEPTHMLPESFWENFEGHTQLLDARYGEIRLPVIRARTWFATGVQLEEFISQERLEYDPVDATHPVLIRTDLLGQDVSDSFEAGTPLVIA